MIVLPLFWDQYNNAQRMRELGLGVRLDTYRFTDDDLHGALHRLLGDTELHARLAWAWAWAAIRHRDGVRRAAALIEAAAAGSGMRP
jgi:UDP:flavonoid glycosyltransferase YjiC (YdhE family)